MSIFNVKRAALLAAMLAVVSLGGGATTAGAQQIVVEKDLCGPAVPGGGCVIGGGGSMPLIAPYTALSYEIMLTNNDPGPTDVDLGETFPAGFVPTGTTCGTTLPTGPSPLFFGPVSVPAQGQTTCLITGYFNYLPATANNANNEVTVYAVGDHERPIVVSNQVNASVASPATMPSDVSVVKDAMVIASGNGTTTVHYTITVTNNGPNDVYGLQLQDRVALPATSIPLTVSNLGNEICTVVGSGGSDCFAAVPSTDNSPLTVPSISPVDFVEWSYPTGAAGLLAAGDSIVIEFDVLVEVPVGIACQLVQDGNELINEAHIGFNIPGATTTTFETAPGNNTSTVSVPVAYDGVIDPNCGQPALQISKTLAAGSPAVFAWGDTVTYDITLTNSSSQALTNIQLFDAINGALGDFVSGGIGTPSFTAEVVGIACLPTICSSTVPSVGPQSVTGYLNSQWMLGASIPSLGAQSSVTFQISIKFSDPACDSYTDVAQKPVLNFVRGRYADPTLGGADITLQTAPAIALFEAPVACDFRVTKQVNDGSDKIVFGQNVHYTVTYENLNAQPMTLGTMIDTLRLTQLSYAWPLTVHYDYMCTESGGVTGFPFGVSQSGVVQVVPTSLPQQGVRIIQNLTPVVFPGNSIVTCEVRISVDAPVGAAQCGRLGELENAAIMDQSAFYNPNLPWSTTPGFYDTESLPLPQCIDLVVNKSADPLWTTQNGGPISYQLVITNLGDPIVATDGVAVSDTFAPNVTVTPATDACLDPAFGSMPAPQVPSCDYAWSSPPPANPSALAIQTLDHNWSANPHFTSTAPYPPPPSQVCNTAVATLSGMNAEDWYARDPSTWETHRCVPIFDTKDLKVGKLLDIIAPATAPAATIFTVDVVCSWQFNGTNYGLSDTLTFAYPPNPMPPQGVATIPINSACTITEQQLPVGPFPDKRCPSGFATWGAITYPNAVGPDGTPQSGIVGNNSSNTLLVHNVYECVKDIVLETGSLFVGKDVVNNTSADLSGWLFPVTVDCTGQPSVSLDLAAGQYSVIHNLPIGTDCHVTEDWQNIELPPAEKACPPGLVPQWRPAGYEPASQSVSGEPVAITVHNVLDCVRPEKPVDGTIEIIKKVTNNTAADLSGWTYPVIVSCDGGPEVFPSLTDGQSLDVDHIPFGVDCKVGEDVIVVPSTERACPPPLLPQWTISVTPTGYLHAGDTATIHNVLDCVRPEKPVDGTIEVIKKVTNNTAAVLPDDFHYTVTVYCDGGPETTFHLVDGQSGAANHVAPGVECKVIEEIPVLPPDLTERACPPPLVALWTTTVSPAGYLHAGDHATVENALDCVGPEKPTATGTLTVWKYVANQTLFDVSPLQFTIDVNCGGSVTTMTLTNGQSDTVPNVPLGTNCVVTEALPLPMPPGIGNECFTASLVPEWTMPVSYYPGQSLQVAGATDAIYVLNTLTCVPGPDTGTETETDDDGSLSIEKVCSEPVPASSGDGFEAICQITVIVTGTSVPATITITDQLNGPINIPGFENQIVSMTSAQNWTCPAMPVVAGIDASCQLPGADLVAAGGQSVIDVVVHFHDTGNASETQNCVEASGDDGGLVTSVASQICAQFEGPGIAVCDPGMERRGAACVVRDVSLPQLPDFSIEITQPEQCERGQSCTLVVELTNDASEPYAGPLFVSADLPASVGSNGRSIGEWYCARSDMGSLCTIGPDSLTAKAPVPLDLPLMIPERADADARACLMAGAPSSDMERAVARAVQLGLAAHGFKLGTVDGLLGPKSRAAIAAFAKRSDATVSDGEIDDAYRLIFGALPLPDGIERREPTCIALDLKPLPKQATPRQPELPIGKADQPDEDHEIKCIPPLELNRRGTACIPSQDLIELPGPEFPGGIVMPGLE